MSSTPGPPTPEAADWSSLARVQRRAWSRLPADARLRWLEDALRFAHAAGVLARDRERRAAAARAWATGDA